MVKSANAPLSVRGALKARFSTTSPPALPIFPTGSASPLVSKIPCVYPSAPESAAPAISKTRPVCITSVNRYERRNLSPCTILPPGASGSGLVLASHPRVRICCATRVAASSLCSAVSAVASCMVPRPASDASKKLPGCSTRLRAVTARIFGRRSSVQTVMETVRRISIAVNHGAVKMRKSPSRSKTSTSGPRVGS